MILKKEGTRVIVYGERNDPNTVIANNNIAHTFLAGVGNKGIKYIPKTPNSILIANINGKVGLLNLSDHPNKVIATDSTGEIILKNRSELL